MTPAQQNSQQTILIVDDTPTNLGMAVGFLEERGYRVAIAQEGEEGIQRAELVRPDLILLDVMMPGIDGFEVCRRLKAAPATADIPVIFMTALADTDHKIAGFRAGGVDYVTKPLQVDEVAARVDAHLKLSAAQHRLQAQNAELALYRDHLERLVAERTAALTAANEALRLKSFALDRVGEAAYLVDAAGRFHYVNEEACRRLDYPREKLLAFGIGDIDADWPVEQEPRAWAAHWAALRERGSITFETRHQTRSGEIFPVEVSASYFDFGSHAYVLGLARDLTERKAMEDTLREQEGRYRGIFDNLSDTLYLLEVTPEGRFRNLEVNPAFEKSSGMRSADLVGRFTDETVPAETARVVNAKYRRCVEAGVPIDEEATLDLPAGRRHYHSTLVPVRDDSGRIHRIVGISRDITERRKMERQLEESRDQLRDLATRRETAREEERRHIAREIHDELGQQLSALRLKVGILNFQFGQAEPGLRDAVSALLAMVDNTIQVARNVSTSLRPAVVDMGVETALRWLADEFSRHADIPCAVGAIAADIRPNAEQATALFRIAQESLTNIARHAKARRVRIDLSHDGAGYALSIADDGLGFDAGGPRKLKSFGLVGMRERALAVGGDVAIESTPGQGTTVRVRIPAIAQGGTP